MIDMVELVEFKGECAGIRLVCRNGEAGDKHILVMHLTEDDEQWIEGDTFSSHWIDEQIRMLQAAKAWMEANAEPDIYEVSEGVDRQFGWKFK